MDEHNVHHFWGISPAVDLGALLPEDAAALPVDQPIRMLQVAPYDSRHTLTTICRAERHPLLRDAQQQVQLLVWEDSPEGLARHVLLLAVLLDEGLPPRERTELLAELHGNVLMRERAAAYLDEKARQLEALVVELAAAGGSVPAPPSAPPPPAPPTGLAALRQMLDLSMLKFQERDQLVEVLQKWRTSVPYDMVKGWDARARKWYGDRYDFRRNMVDWDYHMRLQPLGTPTPPGCDPAATAAAATAGSIVHFHHFRHWRMHGVAHELRDSAYSQPNRSLLSTAFGRTKEFKDRNGQDVGRSVSAWGVWCDALNSPYHSFGTWAEDPAFYRVSNKQFARTAVDIAEHNLMALLHELRTGTPLSGGEAHRAKVARGPTSLEDLQQQAEKDQQQHRGEGEGAQRPGEGAPAGTAGQRDGAAQEGGSGAGAGGSGQGCEGGGAAAQGDGQAGQQGAGEAGSSGQGGAEGAAAAPSPADAGAAPDAARQEMAAQEAALRAQEAAQDAEARRRAVRFRLVLLSGDLAKGCTGRARFAGSCPVLALGHRHAHMLEPQHGLARVAAGGARLAAENARHVLQLTREQAEQFAVKMDEMAAPGGWQRVEQPAQLFGLTTATHLYRRA